ncbi:hypothetical protein CPY51_15295 [Rhizobium tubonense]|uniref:Endonuclease GajA/Old nuclease/RecF-like AAA domain-containing protein n=1 Tax=Rhizobium tubonense TaxID=484088 RepID=A0A2W4CRC6_9HYPH|nr:hypothetical protein CPY51_15295 [Rhizobium tubonense]
MKLVRLRLKSFRSFGPAATVIDLADLIFLLGPNGSGKTAVLQALARMFSLDPSQRKIRKSDFHVPNDEKDHPLERQLWVEADFEFPELLIDDGCAPTAPDRTGKAALRHSTGRGSSTTQRAGDMEVAERQCADRVPGRGAHRGAFDGGSDSRFERDNIKRPYHCRSGQRRFGLVDHCDFAAQRHHADCWRPLALSPRAETAV